MSQKLFDEAVLFFKGNKTYVKICELAEKKYRTYGKVTGSFSLASFDEAELADIANFLGVSEFSLLVRSVFLLSGGWRFMRVGVLLWCLLKRLLRR
ncbi:hypothetical protein [Listeria cornellensis]|uniref:Uncharacterized protein n=1 Tax=Listeria cornellensis FSL F6-0969 TaxID=1265820 RepID=W7C6Q4_9LIST|nr:hypothetical protein [Listeria cornellensis]EUJ32875.1 hypothetical protein PCORN_00250 [Listeria cornellensis FSL F6-0969]